MYCVLSCWVVQQYCSRISYLIKQVEISTRLPAFLSGVYLKFLVSQGETHNRPLFFNNCQLTVNIQIIHTYSTRLCWEKVVLFQNVLGRCVHQADFNRTPSLDASVMVRKYIRWDPWHVQYCGLHCIIWWLNQDSKPSVRLRHLLWLALHVASSVWGLDCRLLSNHHDLSHC